MSSYRMYRPLSAWGWFGGGGGGTPEPTATTGAPIGTPSGGTSQQSGGGGGGGGGSSAADWLQQSGIVSPAGITSLTSGVANIFGAARGAPPGTYTPGAYTNTNSPIVPLLVVAGLAVVAVVLVSAVSKRRST